MHDEFAGASVAESHVITDSNAAAREMAEEVLARRAGGGLTYQLDPR